MHDNIDANIPSKKHKASTLVLALVWGMYLYDVRWLVYILFKDQHGGGIGVDVELFQQIGRVWDALVNVAELQVVFVGKCCQLWRIGGKHGQL